jgi:hypothetical protein
LFTSDKLKESQSPNAEFTLGKDGTLSLIPGSNMPLNFYEQVENLNWLLENNKDLLK